MGKWREEDRRKQDGRGEGGGGEGGGKREEDGRGEGDGRKTKWVEKYTIHLLMLLDQCNIILSCHIATSRHPTHSDVI